MDNPIIILVLIIVIAGVCVGGYFYFATKARQKREVEEKGAKAARRHKQRSDVRSHYQGQHRHSQGNRLGVSAPGG